MLSHLLFFLCSVAFPSDLKIALSIWGVWEIGDQVCAKPLTRGGH